MLPSLKVPIAVNCVVVPCAIDVVKGVIAIDCTVALVAVTTALEEMLPEAAVIVEEPSAMAIANPKVEFALIVTAEGLADVHCTDPVIFFVLPSVNVPVAASCTVAPSGNDALCGETMSAASAAAVTVRVVLPLALE